MAELRGALAVRRLRRLTFVPTRNPYRGLEAFEQADADDFYGRDRRSARWSRSSSTNALLVVVGPSGIGKSSVVKAGLLPALAGRGDSRLRPGWSPRWCPGETHSSSWRRRSERIASATLSRPRRERSASGSARSTTSSTSSRLTAPVWSS